MKIKDKVKIFMDRFNGRKNVYGVEHVVYPNGQAKKAFYPARYDNGEYKPLDEEVIKNHIRGSDAINVYLLKEDATVYFAAMDFDYKPDKPQMAYYWEDVKATSNLLLEWQVPHAIARSTTNGFHIYLFFSEPVPANKVRAVIFDVYEKVGFMEEVRLGNRPIPETFPRQHYTSGEGIGNGIKPPMIEANWEKERNCLVDENNQMIPQDNQWGYLANVPKMTEQDIDNLIEKYEIPVFEEHNAPDSKIAPYGSSSRMRAGNYLAPLNGSIEKVLEGCMALRKIRDKVYNGEVLGHHEGFSLFHICMHLADGKEWFFNNVKGWGETEADRRQLMHSIEKNYAPWTCRRLQQENICTPGTKCFDKKPPLKKEGGRVVPDKSVPVKDWPEPSPIRYGFGKGDDFLLKLQREAEDLKEEEDPAKRIEKVKELAYRAQVFDEGQQYALKQSIPEKVIKKRELNKIFSEAYNQKVEKQEEIAESRPDTVKVNNTTYHKLDYGYAVLKLMGKQYQKVPICNADLWIEEIKTKIDSDSERETKFAGKIVFEGGKEKPFEISSKIWADNAEFYRFLIEQGEGSINVLKQDLDYIRQAILGFSQQKGVENKTYYTLQGWYKDSYITPSVIVDKDGVRPNDEFPLDLSGKQIAEFIDFKILDDSVFKETLSHIKTDFYNTFHRPAAMFGLSHTFLASLLQVFNLKVRPALWIEGRTGNGKSAMCSVLQDFYGNFPTFVNWWTTAKSILDYGSEFKDCVMYVDDYKGYKDQVRSALGAIQYGYDGSTRGALTRSGKQRASKSNQSLFMSTGEVAPSSQASMIARMLLVQYPSRDNLDTKAKYERCLEMKENYCGITPRFLHYVLQIDPSELRSRLHEISNSLQEPIRGVQNADRISNNLAMNFVTHELFVDFMVFHGVCTHEEANDLKKEHWENCLQARGEMVSRCSGEQDSAILLSTLREGIVSGKIHIQNLEGFESERGEPLGFVRDREEKPQEIFFYPGLTINYVKKTVENFVGTTYSVGSQLADMGVLTKTSKGENTYIVRYAGSRPRVWAISINEILGDSDGKPNVSVTRATQDMELESTKLDNEGLI